MTENTNPLQKYYRQPAIYITLPSKGRYYSPDVYTPTENGEIPVLPMTAKDELAFKTPDAMISGQATVDVIKSCVPNLKNPWKMVNHDTDTILLAIRVATYGETTDISYQVPGTTETSQTTINIVSLLEQLKDVDITDKATTKSGFTFTVAPLDYKRLTEIQVAQFEQQKIYATVTASSVTEQQKNRQFAESFRKLNEINFDLLKDSITSVTTPDGVEVTDKSAIAGFLNNAPSKVVDEIQDELGKIRTQAQTPPLKIKATEDQIKKGVPSTFEVPMTFDNSNFFG